MIPAERQQRIREALDARGMVSIAEMAEHLGVSHMTLRRDMQALERQGYAVLVSGGAQKIGRIAFELPQAEKRRLQYAEKTAIARKAVVADPSRRSGVFRPRGPPAWLSPRL